MTFGPVGWTVVVAGTLLSAFTEESADENAVAPPEDIAERVVQIIPHTWTCEHEENRLIVRAPKQPVFVNLLNRRSQRPTETLEEYHRRHIVEIDYRIVLRFERKLSQLQIRQISNENWAIEQRLSAIRRNPVVLPFKTEPIFPRTPEGESLSREYAKLKRSIRPIPDGYFGDVSVYIEPTTRGFATFLDKEVKRECEEVIQLLTDQITPYPISSPMDR